MKGGERTSGEITNAYHDYEVCFDCGAPHGSIESVDYRAVLSFVTTVSTIAVITQAARTERRAWIVLFLAIITLFNPVLTASLPRHLYLWTDLTCLAAFVASLVFLKSKPVLSIASITDRTPGCESL